MGLLGLFSAWNEGEINQIMKRKKFNIKQFGGKIGIVVFRMYTHNRIRSREQKRKKESQRDPINHFRKKGVET